MTTTPKSVGHRPRRRFGQNFLHDPEAIARIVTAIDPQPAERMVEIGPGLGAITYPLLERLGELDVVELDRDLAAHLSAANEQREPRTGLRVHVGDALRFDFSTLARRPAELRVVGNLPYNVSTPMLFHLLDEKSAIHDMHFLLQREVVERIVATAGTAAYGRLSLMVQYHCRAEMLFTVPSAAFSPPPKVTSALVRLTVHRRPPVEVGDPRQYKKLVAQAFSQRRKTLRNSLKSLLDESQIRAAGIDPSARPETLDLAAVAALSRALSEQSA